MLKDIFYLRGNMAVNTQMLEPFYWSWLWLWPIVDTIGTWTYLLIIITIMSLE